MGIEGNYVLVWFGLYICPDKPKPIYRESWAKEKLLSYYFLLTRHCLFLAETRRFSIPQLWFEHKI